MAANDILSFLNFGVLFLLLLQLNILHFSQASPTTENDLLRKQKPLQRVVSVYADSAKFDVTIPNPTGGPFVRCSERGSHVVQTALQSNRDEFTFSKNVTERSDGQGYIVKNLNPDTEYVVRVACRFTGATQPGDWSDPVDIRTTIWTSKITGDGKRKDGSNQEHHHHDHQHDGNNNDSSEDDHGSDHKHNGTAKSSSLNMYSLLFILINVVLVHYHTSTTTN